jgi:hypothetical protein
MRRTTEQNGGLPFATAWSYDFGVDLRTLGTTNNRRGQAWVNPVPRTFDPI